MVNFLVLFCSLIIQLGAVSIPYELVPDDNTLLLIQEIRNACLNSEDAGCLFFADTVQAYGYSTMPYYIELGSNGSNNYRICFPTSYQNTSLSSSCTSTWYMLSNGAILCNIRWVNYTVFWYNTDTDTLSSSQNRETSTAEVVVPFRYGEGRTSLVCLNGDIRDENGNIIIYYEDFVQNTDDNDNIGNLVNIGSLNLSGHTSGGSPMEELQGFSFTAHSSSYIQSGHNTHVNPNNATPDYTNATQNLLAQIVDNTNSIIENGHSLGGALETINANIVNGVTALFNGISQLNNNFVSSVIIDKEELSEQWEASNTYTAFSSMRQSYNLLESTTNNLISRYSATEDINELIIPIDLTVWQIESSNFGNFKPFDQVYYMRFGFLDETKALWQPLFIALLYFCLFYGIVLDLPNIIRGVKS